MDPAKGRELIKFGEDFELDLIAYRLRRAGRVLRLERIPTEILLLLVKQRGQIVGREQIVDRIWGKNLFVDTDNAINGAIRKIRQALRDDPEQPRFIQTVSGSGYRFIAPVSETSEESQATASVPKTTAPERLIDKKWFHHWAGPLVVGFAIVLAVVLGAYWQWYQTRVQPQASSGRLMLAVMPFENLTGDASQDYFSDGMTEEMIAQLGRINSQQMGVIARTSVMQYKSSQKPLDQIGRELGVQYVLEGSVRRDSDKVRITAQLIQVKDQTHLWARQYDREQSRLLALQDEIATEVTHEIELTLEGHERVSTFTPESHSSTNPEAYELYLKGRYSWNKRTTQGLHQAIDYFQQAVDKDPTFARAYAGLAESYALISGYSLDPPDESIPKARAAARRALEIDERLPEAHAALAVIAQDYDWDWPTAEREYQRAIQLDPNYATGHHWYAECLALQGRFEEAFPEIERARQLDPLSLIIATDYGAILYFSRQYDRAIEQFRAVLDMEPNFPRAHMLIYAYAQEGRFTDALADAKRYHRMENIPWSWALLAYVYGRSGQAVQARSALENLEQLRLRQPTDPLPMVVAEIGIGDKDRAFEGLQKAYLAHSGGLTAIKVDPIYDPLRSDPRFQEILRRVRLTQ